MPELSFAGQLERILYILPVAARADGVTLDELSSALGADQKTVLRELEQAMTRAYYHPAGSVDAFSITIEADRVRVHAPDEFKRPVRLNAREALALELGLRCLAAEAAPERRASILALAQRLERELKAPDVELQPRLQQATREAAETPSAPLSVALHQDDCRGLLADAIDQQRICTISYLKSGAPEPELRRIAPLNLVHGNGQWYAVAHDQDRDDNRLFRLDRILEARLESEGFERAALDSRTASLLERGFAYEGGETEEHEVRVRYSPRVARWLAEHLRMDCKPDGSLVLTHHVSDPDWLVRHVLQYGGDAEVLEPVEARARVRSAAQRLTDI